MAGSPGPGPILESTRLLEIGPLLGYSEEEIGSPQPSVPDGYLRNYCQESAFVPYWKNILEWLQFKRRGARKRLEDKAELRSAIQPKS